MSKIIKELEELIKKTNYEIELGSSSEYDDGGNYAKELMIDSLQKIIDKYIEH